MEFLGETKIDVRWCIHLDSFLRKNLDDALGSCKPGDTLIFKRDGNHVIISIESYSDRKNKRESES